MENTETEPNFQPFKNIGLCLSGGGYRAAFFSLGIISYLEEIEFKGKPLSHELKAISTVSGGTLLGMAFAKALQEENYNFKTFYTKFYNTYKPGNDNLVEDSVTKLATNSLWKTETSKNRNFINSFALSYANLEIYKGELELFDKKKIKQFEHVCFNATDFSYGLPFRFQNTGNFANNPIFDNTSTEINKIKNRIKISDVVAASSCFPMGFSPMIFPDDFINNHKDEDYLNLKTFDKFKKGIGLLDGGIADNQGLASMKNIYERSKKSLNLIIVGDVCSYKLKPWEHEEEARSGKNGLSKAFNAIKKYNNFGVLKWLGVHVGLSIFGVLLLFGNQFVWLGEPLHWATNVVGGGFLALGSCVLLLGILYQMMMSFGKSSLNALIEKYVPKVVSKDLYILRNLKVSLIKKMLINRVTSTVLMTSEVFLKQIRRLNYYWFYSDTELENKRITATIYKLNGKESVYSGTTLNSQIKPPKERLERIALSASKMETTLWWTEDDIKSNRMDALVTCGQFTICYELINYILDLKKAKEDDNRKFGNIKDVDDFTEINKLLERLEADWNLFNGTNPKWLLDKYAEQN